MKAPTNVLYAVFTGLFLFIVVLLAVHSSVVAQGSLPTKTPARVSQPQSTPVLPRSSVSNVFNLFLPFVIKPPQSYSNMVYIPVGTFQMGCDVSIDDCGGSYYNGYAMEKPLHTVNLSAYYIDQYEVTNARYAACVAAGVCLAPWSNWSANRTSYYGDPAFANYPVIYLNWYMADTFCRWEGKRLPTEAEWEKAARGSTDTRMYPWGSQPQPIDCAQANVRNVGGMCVGDTTLAGSYPGDVSPYGVVEMSGNVWNWVNDWYQENYYSFSPYDNPQGPGAGVLSTGDNCNYCRVVRGGSWFFEWRYARTSYRGRLDPFTLNASWVGIRCARS